MIGTLTMLAAGKALSGLIWMVQPVARSRMTSPTSPRNAAIFLRTAVSMDAHCAWVSPRSGGLMPADARQDTERTTGTAPSRDARPRTRRVRASFMRMMRSGS